MQKVKKKKQKQPKGETQPKGEKHPKGGKTPGKKLKPKVTTPPKEEIKRDSTVESIYHNDISSDESQPLHQDALYSHSAAISEPGEGDDISYIRLKPSSSRFQNFPRLSLAEPSSENHQENRQNSISQPSPENHQESRQNSVSQPSGEYHPEKRQQSVSHPKSSSDTNQENLLQDEEHGESLHESDLVKSSSKDADAYVDENENETFGEQEETTTMMEESSEEEDDEDEEEEYFPKTPPITPVKVETWEDKLQRFNQMMSNNTSLNEVSYIYDLRGFHSEPALVALVEKPSQNLFKAKSFQRDGLCLRKLSLSMNDIHLTTSPYPHLMNYPIETTQDFCHYLITKRMKTEWNQFFMKEKKRFSFFDELFAKGYVVDSMEVPANKNDLSYFVEADKSTLKKHVKYARLCFKTKNMYTGHLKNWYFQGNGIYKWVDGAVYEGEFLKGVMHGEGKLTWTDGSVYEGQFFQGVRSGWGVYSTAEGYTYAGDWENGLPEGKGKMWYDPLQNDTDFYDGAWKKGVPHGTGTRIYANGDRYVGLWESGVRHGKGSIVWLVERQIYKGEWKNGLPNGRGQHTWFLERSGTSQFSTRHVYQGEWVDGVEEGIGRMVYPNGSWIEGRWHNGERQGKGIFVSPNGNMLVGLFRAGSIIGGNDVTLHSPSHDCDFNILIESLITKFNLTNIDQISDEEILTRTTKRCLVQIRHLYERAGRLGQWWGAPGQHPDWLHNEQHEVHAKIRRQTATSRTELGGGGGDAQSQQQKKFMSPDNVYPVIRFGLWLLMKDCSGILSAVTTAEYDKIWSTIDSISFQTRHNPFEPVYLWQFLQCLIVISTVLYIEIPIRRKKWKFGVESLPAESETNISNDNSPTEVTAAETIPGSDDNNTEKLAPAKSTSKSSEVDSVLKLKMWYDGEGEEETSGEEGLYLPNEFDDEESSEGEFLFGAGDWKSSRDINTGYTTGSGETEAIPFSAAEGSDDPNYDKTHQGYRSTFRKSQQQSELGIGKAFEKFLVEKLIPYLDHELGSHLPRIPTPLPALSDLYKSFHMTHNNKDRDLITGVEFLRSILPDKNHLNSSGDSIFWYRSKESIATNADLNFICHAFKDQAEEITIANENGKLLGDEFLGERINNTEIFKGEMKREVDKPRGQLVGSIEIYGSGNSVFGVNENLETTEVLKEENEVEEDSVVTYVPFSERDLAPKPFLWKPKRNCIHVARKESVLKNLRTNDVIKVFQYLYPNVCGLSQEINLEFEMTFCDWFWCTSLIAKICADREFYSSMRTVEPPKITPKGYDDKCSRTPRYHHTHSNQKPSKDKAQATLLKATKTQSMPLLKKGKTQRI